jgi:hypothetical protein
MSGKKKGGFETGAQLVSAGKISKAQKLESSIHVWGGGAEQQGRYR